MLFVFIILIFVFLFSLKYIPFDDAEVHKQTISLTMQHGQTPPSDRESPSLLPLLKRTPSPR